MRIKRKALAGTLQILRDSQAETEPYTTMVAGKEFVVLPGFFSPRYFRDTEFFAEHIPFQCGMSFLEIGPGTGVIAILAALHCKTRVHAIDINPIAVANTKLNAKRHDVEYLVTVFRGDVYSPLPRAARYDTIFWNTPFAYLPEGSPTDLERAVIDLGYEATRRYIEEGSAHLTQNGRLFIGFSTTLGNLTILQQIVGESGFRLRKLAEIDSVEAHPVKFQLFEAVKK